MKILLTNDDGYDAPGLECLKSVLSQNHEVWVVAPLNNKSGSSCSFNFGRMELKKISDRVFALDGSPVDCVLSAVNGSYLPGKPDVVLSGINAGCNLGTDIVYSGTCGGARQGSLCGIPSIAVSVEFPEKDYLKKAQIEYKSMALFIKKNLNNLISFDFNKYYLNINANSKNENSSYSGIKITDGATRIYPNNVVLEKEGDVVYSTMSGGKVLDRGSDFCDVFAVEKDFISISAVLTEPSCSLDALGDMLKNITL